MQPAVSAAVVTASRPHWRQQDAGVTNNASNDSLPARLNQY